ncbi:DUF4097 family beta strand repeat-containing protein [Allokutzneria sp. NRRL B-24872]|uniref:DUF4097 family beta strand repeat-containing protein n=1 Tax=Allokutzneria sp. NRRL B-24872 TaxID=1137961 RepID=UPI000A39ECAF|nr:DUF4097 family beta strand repeat-containing protein [Allokutzneria sp. NRRL B-24872]
MSTFSTPAPVTATVEVAGAQVRVIASDRSDTVVRVEPIDATNRTDVKVAERTKVSFAEGRLSVKTTVSGAKSGSVAITIDLPTGSGLATYLAHSTVRGEGSFGECELHIASGRVHVESVEALRANLTGGDVTVGRVAGRTDVDGAVFEMRIGEAGGPVTLSGSGGQTWIGHARADVDLRSASGGFDIDRADGGVTAETANGRIRVGLVTRGQTKLVNSSGTIEVGVAEDSAASIDASSERGATHDFVSQQGNPASATEKIMVHARSRNGDVIIQRSKG